MQPPTFAPPIRLVWFVRFPKGKAKEEARKYWAEHHGPMCAGSSIER